MSPTALTPSNPITLADLINTGGNTSPSNTEALSDIPSSTGAYTPMATPYSPTVGNGIQPINSQQVSSLQNAQNILSQVGQTAKTTKATTGKQPSWWEKLAPTIGGIGGSILGDVGGALAAPLTGGIVNPWDLSTALSALGGGVGQAISNEGQGKGLDISSDLKEAALMGGSNLAGVGIAKGLGAAGKALVSTGASQATDEALADTATKAYNAVPKAVRQAYDLDGSQRLADEVGIGGNNFTDMASQGHTINNAVDSRLNSALAGQTIDTGDLQSLNDALNGKVAMGGSGATAQIKNLSPEAQAVVDAFDKVGYDNPAVKTYIDQVGKISQGLLDDSGSTDAQAFRQATKQVGDLYGSSIPTGTAADTGAVNPIQKGASDALNTLYHYMDDTTFGAEGADAAIKNMTPDITAEEVGGNQKLADMGNEAIQSGDKQQIKDFLHSTGNMASMGDAATTASKGLVKGTADTGATGASKLFKAAKPILGVAGASEAATSKNPIVKLAGAAAAAPEVMDLLTSGTGAQGAGKLISLLSRIGRVTPEAGAGLATMPQAQPTANTSIGVPMNMNNAPAIQALHEAMMTPLLGGLNQLGNLVPQAQKIIAAQSDLTTLMSLYNQAGGAQGTGNGLLSRLQGLIPGSAQGQYLRAQPALANTMAGLTGGTPSAMASLMPTFTQNPQTAQTNLSGLAGALGLTQ